MEKVLFNIEELNIISDKLGVSVEKVESLAYRGNMYYDLFQMIIDGVDFEVHIMEGD